MQKATHAATVEMLELQACELTRMLLSAIAAVGSFPNRFDFSPEACPNCGRLCNSKRSPYCSESCRATAAFVRQFRAAIRSGTIHHMERQVSFGQTFWHLAGGGRPLRRALAPEKAVRQAFQRTGGLCEACGASATTVDHIGSG